MNNDPNLIGGNTRVIDIPENMVQRDVYEYILYIGEVVGILPNGEHQLPKQYADVIDAILKIRQGDGLEIVHGGYFKSPTESNIQSHNASPYSHENLKLDAGQIQQINNELVSVVPLDEDASRENDSLPDHNVDQYAHQNMIADGQIFDGELISPDTSIEEHNEDPTAHGAIILDGNIDD